MGAFVALPAAGRVFRTAEPVRSTDVTPAGRLRFDALARYLQEAAERDLADAGYREPQVWLVRRTAVTVRGFPRRGERVTLATFCSATGPRWAERTTTLAGRGGDLIQAVAVWAAVGRADGRPAALGPRFAEIYGAAAAGRSISARLSLPRPPDGASPAPWPLRAADFDMARHVNNAVHWAAVEDVLAGQDWLPGQAVMEYPRAIEPGAAVTLAVTRTADTASLWLLGAGRQRLAAAFLARPLPPSGPA